mgnify:CR=1 FL=1
MGEKAGILIVDDDPGMSETLADILSETGYGVAVAGDGYRAMAMIKEKIYDVALMDIKMPGINGVETFKEVKRLSPSTGVIMMTAYALEDLVQEALAEGALSIFYKPLDIDRVVGLIEKVGQGVLILVVDDDPNMCETLKDLLEQKSYKVGVAHSGREAIGCAQEKAYDIVFMDVKMPDINGLEAYLAIKDINPKITAVMMTGYGQEVSELLEEAMGNNAYTCLHKPMDLDRVVALVDEIFRLRCRGGSLRKPGDGGD